MVAIIIFTVLLTIGSVNAENITATNNATDVLEESPDNSLSDFDENPVNSFSDLDEEIWNSQPNSVLNLTESYKFNSSSDEQSFSDGVTISKNLTIVGKNNACIDGNGSSRLLVISANCNVVLKNLTFKNGYSSSSGAGILLKHNATLVVDNCVFENNTVYNSNGGAIGCLSGTNVDVRNSRFVNNTSIRVSDKEWENDKCGMGSAICVTIDSVLNLYKSAFISNNAYLATILVVTYDDIKVKLSKLFAKECLFENNTSNSSGVIYLDELGYGEILDSTFRNNVVTDAGAALILDASNYALVKNCLFDSNVGVKGGAIHIKVFDYSYLSNVSIIGCNFTKNRASVYGGAISAKYANATITNCRFTDNTADTNGGAIYTKLGVLRITNAYFENNKAENGGAIYLKDDGSSVQYSSFDKNVASLKGGAIYSKSENILSSNCKFTKNTAQKGVNVYGVFWAQVTQTSSYFSNVRLSIKLTSPWVDLLSQNIKLRFKGASNYKTDWIKTGSNGVLNLKVPLNLKVGKYSLEISMDSGVCYVNPITINVVKAPSKATVKKVTVPYNSGKTLKVSVKNSKTKTPVENAKLTVKAYTGKKHSTYTITTDKKGVAKFDTSRLSVGKHKIVISAADKSVKLSKVQSSVNVKKASAKISAPKKVKKSSGLVATVKTKVGGKPIKEKFEVKITGKSSKTLKAKSNSKGILKISTKKFPKGKYKISFTLKNQNYNINKKISVRVK
jgi:predicted outer membrane repeat protein